MEDDPEAGNTNNPEERSAERSLAVENTDVTPQPDANTSMVDASESRPNTPSVHPPGDENTSM